MPRPISLLLPVLGFLLSVTAAPAEALAQQVQFNQHIRPIFAITAGSPPPHKPG